MGDTLPSAASPLQRRLLSTEVAAYIKCEILGHRLLPGARLIEAEFAENLQISKSPVREAFRLLEREGLVVSHPHRGSCVVRLDVEDLWEIDSLRAVLEGFAAQLAIDKIDDRGLNELSEIVDAMGHAIDEEGLSDLHVRFHQTAVDFAGHARISEIVSGLLLQTRALLSLTQYLMVQGVESVQHEHRVLIEGLARRDRDEIRRLFEKHIYDQMSPMTEMLSRAPER